jgi:hypothetical protein
VGTSEVALIGAARGHRDQLANRLGYQDDSSAANKEAKSLLAAAGQSSIRPLDFMVRDLNHQSNLRTVVESVWFGDATAGNYDLAVGAIVSTLLDPSDYFNAWYPPMGRRTTRSGTTPSLTNWWIKSTWKSISASVWR